MDKLGQSFICGALFFFFYHTSQLPATSPHTSPQFSWVSNCRKKIDLLSSPGHISGIWLEFNSLQGGFWPKMRPAQSGVWFLCQNVGERSRAKGFRNSFIQHALKKRNMSRPKLEKKNIKLTKLLQSIFWDLKWEYSCECLRRTWVTVSIQVWLHHPLSYWTNIHGITSLLTNTHTRPKTKLQMRKRMNIFSPS